MTDRVALLDFDGTLARRDGLWGACVIEVLTETVDGHGVRVEDVREGLRDGFPWHRPDEPHPHLSDPVAWWAPIELLIVETLVACGLAEDLARQVARGTRVRFSDPSQGWQVFHDTLPALRGLHAAGWRCAVLSNHIPELAELVAGLGLGGLLDPVLSSAVIGYEKPHPEAFAIALRQTGDPHHVWMIGDNPTADVAGAEAVGIPAILVRRDGSARYRRDDLLQAVDLVLSSTR